MTNQLASATSPYLRQHADNPVHWRQWTPEALAQAAARDVPILLSVGYAACHWCHVMAHESFEDEQVAAAMNDGFVCIKVDREERPDLDAIYMNATVALTGQGGWPMTCFLTPDGRPFFCGTYYPKPSFLQLLQAVSDTWRTRRGEVEQASDRITDELRSMTSGLATGGPPVQPALCDHAVASALRDEDVERGGFVSNQVVAPKFPPSALLEALLRNHERTGDILPMEAVRRTCMAMARGGIYDQLAGGFARYSVDASWVVPHFEKMLYDNAQLLRVYAHWARRTSDPLARKVTHETARFIIDELGADGMFTSSLDADADGVEGLTYVWTPAQLREVLGEDDARWAAEVFEVTEAGTFEAGSSVLQLPRDPDDVDRFTRVRTVLLAARLTRPQPARDDKVVTAWNGLAITALAEAAVALERPELLDAATQCARAVVDLHLVDGRLRRASLGGRVGEPAAVLEDHAALATGLLTLYQMTGEASWLDTATTLIDVALAHFADPERAGRWFDSADDAEALMVRPADPLDGATPSGASLIAEALLLAAHLVAADRVEEYAAAADATLASCTPILTRAPRSGGHWLAVAEAAVRGPLQIAVACDPDDSELLAAARRLAPGGAVVVGGPVNSSALLADRDRVDGADAAYVCRGRVCDLPVRTAQELAAALDASV
ncbi:thioredoxin domain-containing protein [Mycolicibacterium holsaticum]|uniref:thioredoxin domain-containing protein n=1 Tax=Mycolicibacterium holsaticum TaxID=152142 RepID=UPI001C7D70B3|nr:thioredoxin domain-containing protein [Mycolicibacterium holsaticum]MDA4105992.1 membrane protein [Mycolicibacterium holsaticum DSM 44478 = JCM 12374]QZA13670.1 thioredoxin domain-containing protein [Mycolicibacterium holsaticum DSM 44478 = JCM 12374]